VVAAGRLEGLAAAGLAGCLGCSRVGTPVLPTLGRKAQQLLCHARVHQACHFGDMCCHSMIGSDSLHQMTLGSVAVNVHHQVVCVAKPHCRELCNAQACLFGRTQQ
jgi:hypothetical protein